MADRILTIQVGSVPRSTAVTALIFAAERGEAVDAPTFDRVVGEAMDACVARQVASDTDLVSDGEMCKISYEAYIRDRITGFDGDSPRTPPADLEAFPRLPQAAGLERRHAQLSPPLLRRADRASDAGPARAGHARLARATAAHRPVGAFMNAASPGVIALFQPNHHYKMRVILPTLMRAKPAGLLFETAIPRHQHDWQAFRDLADLIPEDKVLIPGVIDSTTNFIEHPEMVAPRIATFVDLVGPGRVMAGTDCGFSTFAGFGAIDPDIVYAKLATLAEGARLVSDRMGKRAA